MPEDDGLKSAVELAMEKLRARGDYTETSLTDAQKAEISDIRSLYKSKIAEHEIHEAAKMKQATTLEELETMKEALAKEKERLSNEMEDKVKKIRSSK